MGERDAVEATAVPATVPSLTAQLRALGVEPGDVLVVHASLSALGFVIGGAQAVVEALMAAVGPAGTVTMPAHSSDWSEPSYWQAPPVPATWWQEIRDHMPAFDPHATPLREMGSIADTLHRLPGTVRSSHPCVSHMGNGPHAARITADHALAHGLGEGSPLARLYELDAKVLLLGVGHANNTSLHLAEYRADWPGKRSIVQGSPVLVDGERRWVTYEDLDGDTDDFEAVGAAFAAGGGERSGPVGSGTGRLMRQRALVDFATTWFTAHRDAEPRAAE
jgi:aminoglycoside 3-N-acetyltransferase